MIGEDSNGSPEDSSGAGGGGERGDEGEPVQRAAEERALPRVEGHVRPGSNGAHADASLVVEPNLRLLR